MYYDAVTKQSRKNESRVVFVKNTLVYINAIKGYMPQYGTKVRKYFETYSCLNTQVIFVMKTNYKVF